MRIRPAEETSARLLCRAAELLAYGILPIEQWANVFANPAFQEWPGLRAKAFSVWFPTMVDFLRGSDEFMAIRAELLRRNDNRIEEVADLYEQLSNSFRETATLLSIHEQAFVRDRRLQNVHGRLQLYTYEFHEFPVLDPEDGIIRQARFSADEYRGLMAGFYKELAGRSADLLGRVISSEEFTRLSALYRERLVVAEHLEPMLRRLGVSAAAGSG